MKKQLHNPLFIIISSLVGGPIISGYLISSNFKSVGDFPKSRNTLLITLLLTIISILTIRKVFIYKPERAYLILIAILFFSGLISYVFILFFQRVKIRNSIQNDYNFYPKSKTLLIGFIGTIINYFIIFSIMVSINISNYKKTAANIGFMKVGLDNVTSAICKSQLQFQQTEF